MKYLWRITKYDPKFRDENGSYVKDEWTSLYDVGKKYEDEVFTIEQYLIAEEKYIGAILKIMNSARIPYLQARKVYKWEQEFKFPEYYTESIFNLYYKVKENDLLKKDQLQELCKLALRENLGCQLWYKTLMYVHFGYDYYMYIGINKKCNDALESIRKSGLFIEQYESPYLKNSESDEDL